MFKEYNFYSLFFGDERFLTMESISMVFYQFLFSLFSSISPFDGVLELFESGVICLLSEIHIKMQVQ